MTKFLIYQHYFKVPRDEREPMTLDDDDDYFKLSQRSIRRYSERFGHHYHLIDKKHAISPFYAIFDPFTEGWCHDYDAVCWIDSDVLATATAADLFASLELKEIAGYMMDTHGRFWNAGVRRDGKWFRKHGHMNTGVVVVPRTKYEAVTKGTEDIEHLHGVQGRLEKLLGSYDQAIFNKILQKLDSYEVLDSSFNYHLGRQDIDKRFDQSLIHYWRKFKSLLTDDFSNDRILK